MKLKFTTETIHSIAGSDFDEFVRAHYAYLGKSIAEYSAGAIDGWGHDHIEECQVNAEPLDQSELDDWVDNPTGPQACYILDDLCSKGLIEPGTYQIFTV